MTLDKILWLPGVAADRSRALLRTATSEDKQELINGVSVVPNFISESEEEELLAEVEKTLAKLHYETAHWDDAIQNYRETEKSNWTQSNKNTIERMRSFAFESGTQHLPYVHVLDLKECGVIKPHIDSVRYCGDVIAGLCLLSSAVMRLSHEHDPADSLDILLQRRSLYALRGIARYHYKHAILSNEESVFKGLPIKKGRRISIMCRSLPLANLVP